MGGHGQPGAHLVAVIGCLVAEWAGTDKQGDMAAAHALGSQLFCCPFHIAGERLVHGADLGDALPETSAADDLLFGLRKLLEVSTGDAPQLLHRSLHHDPILAPQALGVGSDKFGHSADPLRLQFCRQPMADAPDFFDWRDGHQA